MRRTQKALLDFLLMNNYSVTEDNFIRKVKHHEYGIRCFKKDEHNFYGQLTLNQYETFCFDSIKSKANDCSIVVKHNSVTVLIGSSSDLVFLKMPRIFRENFLVEVEINSKYSDEYIDVIFKGDLYSTVNYTR